MKLKLQTLPAVAILAILLAAPASATADVVADWNLIAVQAVAGCPSPTCVPPVPARPGPSGIIDIAIVHAAIYDAIQNIEKQFKPYLVEIPGASGNPIAAAAKAAHDVLVSRFPTRATFFDELYSAYLLNNGLDVNDPGVAAGIEVGARVAAGIIAKRACDGSFPSPPPVFFGGTGPGVWRPTPPNEGQPMVASWLGFVTPYTLTSPSQFRAEPPPALTSREYTRDYNEVKAKGALNNSTRTQEQTDLAHFWNLNYVVVWNRVVREIAAIHLINNISESSRLFALATFAMADAIITSWNSKIYFNFWRPSTAIQLGHTDNNPQTVADPFWLPLINNPNYPDYTSGANNISSAATRALALFFGTDHLTFSVTTTNAIVLPPKQTRTFSRLSDAVKEVVDARIYEGIHFRFADTAARKQGRQVARWAFENFLRPLDDHKIGDDNDHHDDHH